MQGKKIAVGADHAGCPLKNILKAYLEEKGYEVLDFGTNDATQSVDYPDKAQAVAQALETDQASLGVLVCGSGIGMSIAVNRYPFIRGALVYNEELAKLSRQHNNSNVLILGGRFIDEETAKKCLDVFLSTEFEGGRHLRRVEKLEGLVQYGK